MIAKTKILGICGSLRKNSYNLALLKAALELAPKTCEIELFSLHQIPLFNQDEEGHMPAAVLLLKEKVRSSDALLIATPEYNYSFPGVLKNALDWGSRPSGDSCWNNKIVALMGASPSQQGTSRAQYHLRQVFVALNMHPLNRPEFMLPTCQDKFDAVGKLIDPKARQKLEEFLEALIAKAH